MRQLTLFIFLNLSLYLCSQNAMFSKNEIRDRVISLMEENNTENVDYNDIIEQLENLLANPINLNQATEEDLNDLFFLNETQIYNFLVYRYTYNRLMTIYELKLIPMFDSETIQKILPFVKVESVPRTDTIRNKSVIKHNIIARYQRAITSSSVDYLGSPDRYYLKYKLDINKRFIIGFVADKDAGEPFFKGANRQGFDFYSGYLQMNDLGVFKKTIIGDFNIEIGQGLTLWSSIAFGRSSSDVSLYKSSRGLSSKTSSMEGLFFRGAATQIKIKNLEILPFFSYRNIDATVSQHDYQYNPLEITSIYTDGYHRTDSEMKRKRSTAELLVGGRVGYKNRRLNIGLTAYYMRLEAPLNPPERVYNKDMFSGKDNLNVGLDYTYLFMNNSLYGEIAISKNGGMAALAGLNINPHSVISLTISGRYYQSKYQNLLSNAVGQYSNNRNEFGVYSGVRLQLLDRLSLIAYGDIYQTLGISYRAYSDVVGQEYMVALNYSGFQRVFMQLKYSYKNRGLNFTSDSLKSIQTQYIPQNRISFRLDYRINNQLELQNLISFNSNKLPDKTVNRGALVGVTASYNFQKIPIKLIAGYTFFETDSYNERIYVYEDDILYGNTFGSYNGNGSRYHIVATYKATRQLQIWLKWSQTFLFNTPIATASPTSELKLQLQLSL